MRYRSNINHHWYEAVILEGGGMDGVLRNLEYQDLSLICPSCKFEDKNIEKNVVPSAPNNTLSTFSNASINKILYSEYQHFFMIFYIPRDGADL